MRKLKAEYATKGFGNASIEIMEQFQPDNKVAITLRVEEGKRIAIKQITFLGNESFDDKQLIRRMKTKPASFLRSGRFEEEKFEADLVALANFYKKNGFIDVVIGPHEMQQLSDRHYELVIRITEGTKYYFGEIKISGNEHFQLETIRDSFTMESGDIFDQEKYDSQLAKSLCFVL
ncbi:MAG: hypothetical protein LRZ88_02410 [Candidatus Cloacimonetes bacterium]|nr:hypothetical protein [Candidatus Cloacimonadota bacterium]